MYATDIMVEEHANISRMLRVIKNMCCSVLDGAAVDTKDFTDIIDFVRNSSPPKGGAYAFPRNGRTHGSLGRHDCHSRHACRT